MIRSSRFQVPMSDHMEAFNASIAFDRRLYSEDIRASVAWARALNRSGRITRDELQRIEAGLERIRSEIESGNFDFRADLEDIHMNIEYRLTQIVGDAGAKLHTGRSRNDQVATDMRLCVRARSQQAHRLIDSLIRALTDTAERDIDVVIPAYTHLQHAEPVLYAHHLLAYAEMFLRDRARFEWAAEQADSCPLGSGACTGNQFGIDRQQLGTSLGFSRLTRNSIDAVSDRDFVCDFLYACSMFLVHVSRLGEDLVLWSSSEFRLVKIDDSFTSGSSMLPQKRNPDACELGRAKSGRVIGHLVAMLAVLKGLPLSYNKDLQEDKECVFDTVDTIFALIPVFESMLGGLRIDRQRAKSLLDSGFLEAGAVADYLTVKGVPFRQAHQITGSIVARAESKQLRLKDLPLSDYVQFHPAFEEDLFEALSIERSVGARDVVGGTAPRRVRIEIARLRDSTRESIGDTGPTVHPDHIIGKNNV